MKNSDASATDCIEIEAETKTYIWLPAEAFALTASQFTASIRRVIAAQFLD